MSELPEDRLTAWISGPTPGLSEDAERGRKELLWIAASVWIAPVFTTLRNAGGAVTGTEIAVIILTTLLNIGLFRALAKGRGWARTLTLALLVPTSIVSGWLGLGGPAAGWQLASGQMFDFLLEGVVFGAASLVLWRSPTIRAYLDAKRDERMSLRSGPQASSLPGGSLPTSSLPTAPLQPATSAPGSTPIPLARRTPRDDDPRTP